MYRLGFITVLFVSMACAQTAVPNTASDTAAEQKAAEEHAAIHAGGIQEGVDNAQKDADDADQAIAPVLKTLTSSQNIAYRKAAAAMQRLINAQVTGDYLFMGGYGSGGLYPNEMHAAFENLVVGVVKQAPAIPSQAAWKAADDALNNVYGQLIAAAVPLAPLPRNSQPSYAITPDGLRREERAWIVYRDAFVAFGRTLHPDLPAMAWMLPLTVSRTEDLRTFYDGKADSYAKAVQQYSGWRTRAIASQDAQVNSERQSVAEVLNHLTPAQEAAWQRVEAALDAYAAAHTASLPHPSPSFRSLHLKALYGELYAIQYNKTHGFVPDAQTAADNFTKNNRALNAEYQADFAATCLFQPVPGDQVSEHRTPEGLRNEQRAWITLRDAWVGFLAMLYPEESPAALGNMFTGSRTFELRMLHQSCERTGQAPREQ